MMGNGTAWHLSNEHFPIFAQPLWDDKIVGTEHVSQGIRYGVGPETPQILDQLVVRLQTDTACPVS